MPNFSLYFFLEFVVCYFVSVFKRLATWTMSFYRNPKFLNIWFVTAYGNYYLWPFPIFICHSI